MRITDVRVKKVEGQNRLKAIASITIEGVFVVHELRVIQGEGGVFVAMPSKKNKQGEFEMWLKTNKLSEGKKHVTRFAMAGKEK